MISIIEKVLQEDAHKKEKEEAMEYPQTLAEKILSEHAGRVVHPGEFLSRVPIDFAYIHDWGGVPTLQQMAKMGLFERPLDPLTVEKMKDLGGMEVLLRLARSFLRIPWDPNRVAIFFDHAAPPGDAAKADFHVVLREYARRAGCRLYDEGSGVCHVVAGEEIFKPGALVIGGDSHTCTGGALGCFATGMGYTDLACAIAFGEVWLMVPSTIRINLHGELQRGVFAKDLILHLMGMLAHDASLDPIYRVLEFGGEGVRSLRMDERMTLSNMAVEIEAKAGLFPSDEETQRYLLEMGRGADFRPLEADEGAHYERVIDIDCSLIVPSVACPPDVDNVVSITDPSLQSMHVDAVYIGTCTNGRYEDFVVAAKILKGKRVSRGTRLIVTPGSRAVLEKMRRYDPEVEGRVYDILFDAGAVVNVPGCGACPGGYGGIPGEGEVVLASHNRNYQGRMGNPNAFTYLASPATCALSALRGMISDPREEVA